MAREHLEPLGLPSRVATRGEAAPLGDRATRLEMWLLRRLLKAADADVEFGLWDGQIVSAGGVATGHRDAEGRRPGRIRIEERGALWRLLWDPDVAFGDLYGEGRIRVEGDLAGVVESLLRAGGAGGWVRRLRKVLRSAGRLPAPSLSRARDDIHHHYDLGNEFYRLWLDEAMQYTCAYYPETGMTLELAQRAKMDHLCRKLWLQPGETVVEAGCGWGGLALHMARCYGVRVRAYNISSEQIAFAREKAREEGMTDQVDFVHDDFRNIDGEYDVFVSVGMLEHVGPGNYRCLGEVVDRCLAPDGRGLIHSIGRDRAERLHPWIEKRIFPGACPPTLGQMTDVFEPAGFSVLDVENLRLHYAATARAWLDRFEHHREQVATELGERFVRVWRLYLAGTTAAFRAGTLQLFQVLFARSGGNGVPRNRAHLYAGKGAESW